MVFAAHPYSPSGVGYACDCARVRVALVCSLIAADLARANDFVKTCISTESVQNEEVLVYMYYLRRVFEVEEDGCRREYDEDALLTREFSRLSSASVIRAVSLLYLRSLSVRRATFLRENVAISTTIPRRR